MPVTRRSMGANVLQPVSENVLAAPTTPAKSTDNVIKPVAKTPGTPGRQVKALKAEVEKKDAENDALRKTIDDLSNALASLNVVQEKINTEALSADTNVEGAKAKKDKNAPQPAKTAYKFYCDSHTPKNAKKGETVDMRQAWKELTPEARAPYQAMADADKARYAREFNEYNNEKIALELYYDKKKQDIAMEFFNAHLTAQAALEKVEAEKAKGKKKAKDPEAPKRPISSYMYFAIEKREEVSKKNAGMAPKDVTKLLGEMWAELGKSEDGAKKYEELAAADRARYEADKAEYDAMIAERNIQSEQEKADRLKQDKEEAMRIMSAFQNANDAVMAEAEASLAGAQMDEMSMISDLTNPPKKAEKKKKDPNAPKKACSAYLFFCNENRAKVKASMPETTTNAELLTEIGRQWKELSEKKKAKFNKMAEKDKVRYEKEMEKYTAEQK